MNREDLTRDAVASARPIGNIHLWPNNGAGALDLPDVTQHVLPPISAVAVINMMIQASWDDDVLFWAHNDMRCPPDTAQKFLGRATEKFLDDAKWGVLFSTYDVLCCFNMKMIRDVGYWDPFFHQYVADVDYYRRMKLKDWSEEYYLSVEHRNGGSSTIKDDPIFNERIQIAARFGHEYYAAKWGGNQGREQFTTPFRNLLKGQRA
jgi:hypothetical protein